MVGGAQAQGGGVGMSATLSMRQEDALHDAVCTVAYFAANGWAATLVDVWRWVDSPAHPYALSEVMWALEYLQASGRLTMRDGRFCFVGSEGLIEGDHAAYRDARGKMRRARRVARWVGMVPGVQGVAVANTLAWEHTHPEGDMDFFVVARPGTLWAVRLLITLPLLLLRARPGIRRHHPIDLTFFVDDASLDLSSLRLTPDDPYLAHWAVSLVWMVDRGVLPVFRAANAWAFNRFPNAALVEVAWYDRIATVRLPGEGAMRALNHTARRLSLWRFPAAIRSALNQSTNVVVNDHVLKFHVRDRRQDVFETWMALCAMHGNALDTRS